MTTLEPGAKPPQRLDDCALLDLVLAGEAEPARGALDPETKARLEEIRRVHAALKDAAPGAISAGLSAAQIEAVVTRAGRARHRHTRVLLRPRRLAAAAVVVFLLALGWVFFVPGAAIRSVHAAVFGGIQITRQGCPIRPVDHALHIQLGDVLAAVEGGEIQLGERFLIKACPGTELTCVELATTAAVLELRSGRLRCKAVGSHTTLTVLAGGVAVKTRDAVFSMQFMDRPDDQLLVDSGEVEVRCRAKRSAVVRRESGRFSLNLFSACPEVLKQVNLEPCCQCKHRPAHVPGYPTHTDPDRALALAAAEGVPVLITREDGPTVAPCFCCCCFVDFHARCGALEGAIWLVLHPERQREHVRRYGLDGDVRAAVVLNSRGGVVRRGRIEGAGCVHESIAGLIRAGREACGHRCD
ncbi:MAG: hypothetical protein JXQ29_06500 [Planctomycetes bacterium]|nr:hypothetical protein [Planctomycetota bacterium]